MKRIVIAALAILAVQVAGAQIKTPDAAKSAVAKAEAATEKAEAAFAANPKKVVKVTTYLAQAKAYADAYASAQGNGMLGMDKAQLSLILNEKPKATEEVVLNGETYVKDSFKNHDYYYRQNALAFIVITKPVVENALNKAIESYSKAYAADVKAQKTKDIKEGIENVGTRFWDEAINYYTLSDFAKAGAAFLACADAKATAPLSLIDSSAYFNAALMSYIAGDKNQALELYKKCYDLGYYNEDGEVYAKLGSILIDEGKAKEGAEYLKEGFVKFPQSQSILLTLINYYISSGENTDELFELLAKAKQNDPTNASIYYVEGNTHAKLGHKDEAVASYKETIKVDPTYDFGYVGLGVFYYDQMIAVAEEANALDYSKWKEYDALMVKYYEAAEAAVEPFETVYAQTQAPDLKYNIAQYLRDIYFRLRNKDQKYTENYEVYNEVVKAGK